MTFYSKQNRKKSEQELHSYSLFGGIEARGQKYSNLTSDKEILPFYLFTEKEKDYLV